jgi:hypothetical protein
VRKYEQFVLVDSLTVPSAAHTDKVLGGNQLGHSLVIRLPSMAVVSDCSKDTILFSTIEGRRKTTNMWRDPRVNLLVHGHPNRDLAIPYATISGTVELTDDPDGSFHQIMYGIHMGGATPPPEPGAKRLIVRIITAGLRPAPLPEHARRVTYRPSSSAVIVRITRRAPDNSNSDRSPRWASQSACQLARLSSTMPWPLVVSETMHTRRS